MRTQVAHALVRDGSMYAFGQVVVFLGGIILLPLYLTNLTRAEYGIYAILAAASIALKECFNLGISQAVASRLYLQDRSEGDRRVMLGSALALRMISVLLLLACGPALCGLVRCFVDDQDASFLVWGTIISAALWQFPELFIGMSRAHRRPRAHVIFIAAFFFLRVSSILVCVLGLGLRLRGVVLGDLVATAIACAAALGLLWRMARPAWSWPEMRALLSFGMPVAFLATLMALQRQLDRFFLNFLTHDDALVGSYNLAAQVAGILMPMLLLPFQQAWQPVAFAKLDRWEHPEVFASVFKVFTAVTCVAVVGLTGLGFELAARSREWGSCGALVPLLAFSYVFMQSRTIAGPAMVLGRKTHAMILQGVVGLVLLAALQYACIPRWGAWGAAIANLLMSAIVLALHVAQSTRIRRVPMPWKAVGMTWLCACACAALVAAVPAHVSGVAGVLLRAAPTFLCAAVLQVTGLMRWQAAAGAVRGFRTPGRG